jgi:hypothetical protein
LGLDDRQLADRLKDPVFDTAEKKTFRPALEAVSRENAVPVRTGASMTRAAELDPNLSRHDYKSARSGLGKARSKMA